MGNLLHCKKQENVLKLVERIPQHRNHGFKQLIKEHLLLSLFLYPLPLLLWTQLWYYL